MNKYYLNYLISNRCCYGWSLIRVVGWELDVFEVGLIFYYLKLSGLDYLGVF